MTTANYWIGEIEPGVYQVYNHCNGRDWICSGWGRTVRGTLSYCRFFCSSHTEGQSRPEVRVLGTFTRP